MLTTETTPAMLKNNVVSLPVTGTEGAGDDTIVVGVRVEVTVVGRGVMVAPKVGLGAEVGALVVVGEI